MNTKLSFFNLSCQTCTAKIHCEQCADTVAQSLLKINGVLHADVNMLTKQLVIAGTPDADDLEEHLENIGILIESITQFS